MRVETLAPGCGPILITGGAGQVGGQLVKVLAPLGEVIAPGRAELDLTNIESIRSIIRAARPRWIVNAAAYTAVDKAESEPELAYAINAEAVRILGEEARQIGAVVIHFSTDYVFDGTASNPYVETDATKPLSVYGASKLAGELALTGSGAAHMIFRTSWVYGSQGKNFLLTILKLAREKEALRVVADQHGAPTWSRDLAEMTAHVILRCENASGQNQKQLLEAFARWEGIYHAAGSGETTWHEFAQEAVRLQQKREPEKKFAEIAAISTAEYPTPAHRPANSRLDCSKLQENLGWRMIDWRESLQKVLTEL
ncbi:MULTISPECIES: dTDP-4-dehydrorhamnose reductase [Acidobacteriaceae]|uniref:dTDP-4-dehydrorhamnose reductase n=1 Tax=Acidobacteriaceae TaxID=204434 RepID=UPI00131A6E41|nr:MULTISPECIES: dTDP-4-dehydrorhamnose reductase [Acidobacteriaceae]MDW5266814.1 dTDP-4-dehydrorhamnose reductase [Edaphobacter sp.]